MLTFNRDESQKHTLNEKSQNKRVHTALTIYTKY